MLTPDLFPHGFAGHDGAPPVYFEAASVITAMVLLGQVLELRARAQTSSAIKALLGLAPKTARRVAADGQLMCFRHDGFWQPMDTFREFELLNQLWKNGQAPWKVW